MSVLYAALEAFITISAPNSSAGCSLVSVSFFLFFSLAGRKFCFVIMRFWLLSTHEGPDDPEGSKIFKVASSEDGGPQKKIVTAVYE